MKRLALLFMLVLASCGGGSNGSGTAPIGGTPAVTPSPSPTTGGLLPIPSSVALSAADVNAVLARAVAEAQARGLPAVIAVTDRVGNVLAVYSMNGARATATLRAGTVGNTDLQGAVVPAAAAAIAKAITGAYLSSNGNAFSTRTASEIVQPEFPPSANTMGLESGPLFGVQFSQLPCSDLSQRYTAIGGDPAAATGPKRSPLGLAADPGGFPLYKNGTLVGGVGVMADGDYGFDPEITDVDHSDEEAIALAATVGFDASPSVTADKISLDGTTLRYSDAVVGDLKSVPAPAPAAPSPAAGALTPVTGYFAGTVIAGTPYGTEASGIRAVTPTEFSNTDAFVLSDGLGHARYPIRAGTDAAALTAAEVRAMLEDAFTVMVRARAAIRRPLDSRAEVTISIVDTNGVVLGQVRGADAPVFGTDVSLQKARTVAFFSSSQAGADLLATTLPSGASDPNVTPFVAAMRTFLGNPAALAGTIAFSESAIGNLSRPYFPDGQLGTPNGPLSRPISQFSPFSTGLQSALIVQNLVQHLGYVTSGGVAPDTPRQCTFLPNAPGGTKRLANGEQIFPGGVPVYRGSTLVGGIGVSGDGIDQDNMISFLGLNNAAVRVGSINNAPAAIRADQVLVTVNSVPTRLRYINCPVSPFVDTSTQNVCQGL